MADINQIVTLGIGIPGDIEHFILFGLNAAPSVAATVVGEILGTASYAPSIDGAGSYHTAIDGIGSAQTSIRGRGEQP